MLCRTPLHLAHQKLGAKLVDFGGWEMPLHYGSQIAEHHNVRRQCAMFDVSHMSIIDVAGDEATQYLHYLLANDVSKLSRDRQALYSVMLNDAGGVVDDLMVYSLGRGFRIVANCATRASDLVWMNKHASRFGVSVNERSDMAMLAIQGPQAIAKVQAILSGCGRTTDSDMVGQLRRFGAVLIDTWHFARTGYTGEDGLEIMLPGEDVEALWSQLLEGGVAPAGLGARDTLRLEAGLNLYGHEMDEQTSPLEANLAWTIAWQPEARAFVGRAALSAQNKQGVANKLVGVLMSERGVLRSGQALFCEGMSQPGLLTSGSFSPTLGYSIGLARVPLEAGISGEVEIRGKRKRVRLLAPSFVRNGKLTFDRNGH